MSRDVDRPAEHASRLISRARYLEEQEARESRRWREFEIAALRFALSLIESTYTGSVEDGERIADERTQQIEQRRRDREAWSQ